MSSNYFNGKSMLFVLVIAVSITFTSCRRDLPSINKDANLKSHKPVVFVAGYESSEVNNVAKYWIDGQEVILSDGTNDAKANSIFELDNDIYIAGSDDGAVYWKNNAEINLSTDFDPAAEAIYGSTANSIFLSGNKVYVAGNDGLRAVYWRDGTEVILEMTNVYGDHGSSIANSVFVSGNDIYVAGSDGPNAVKWKNGVEAYFTGNLTGVAGFTVANSIYVSGNDEYVVGTLVSAGSPFPLVAFWKDEVSLGFTFNNNHSAYGSASSVLVSGNNVYIAGMVNSTTSSFKNAAYWKNGNEIILPSSATYSFATSIYVSGNDVYVAGYEYSTYGVIAVYWKNGVEVKLTDGTNSAYATSIFIK